MSDLLATLLSGIGAGAQQYGKGLGEKAMADQEEKRAMAKTLKMQKIKDTIQAERDLAVLQHSRPKLAERVKKIWAESGNIFPLDESHLKQLDAQQQAEDAQAQLQAMSVRPETQSMMGNAARQAGIDSPLGVTPQTPSAEQAYQLDYLTFADPAQREANQQMQSDNPPSMNRLGMSDASMGSSLATAVDIYMKKKVQAEQNRQVLTDKNEIESKKRMAAAGFGKEDKPDAGSTLSDQELWNQFNAELNRAQTQYDSDVNRYQSKMDAYDARIADLSASLKPEDQLLAKTLKPPKEIRPVEPPILSMYRRNGKSAFRIWATKKKSEFGGLGESIDAGNGNPIDDWARNNISDWDSLDEATKNKIRAKRRKEIGKK